MIVKILQGVPFLVDSTTQNIYAYEKLPSTNPLHLGTYDPVTERFTLRSDWKEVYQPRVDAHRSVEKPRSRLPAATK